jgi:hypothetical protein
MSPTRSRRPWRLAKLWQSTGRAADAHAVLALGKALRVLGHAEFFEPITGAIEGTKSVMAASRSAADC